MVTHEPTDLLEKIGAQVVRHARVIAFELAEDMVCRDLFHGHYSSRALN